MTAYDIAKLHGHQNVCDVLQQTHQQEGSESIKVKKKNIIFNQYSSPQ